MHVHMHTVDFLSRKLSSKLSVKQKTIKGQKGQQNKGQKEVLLKVIRLPMFYLLFKNKNMNIL